MQVRWGIIGCGDIVRKRVAAAIRDEPRSRLVAGVLPPKELERRRRRRLTGRRSSDAKLLHYTRKLKPAGDTSERNLAQSMRTMAWGLGTADAGVPEEEASHRLEAIDREHGSFAREHFLTDPADPQHYDLILNFTRYGVAGCAALIVDALDHLQAHKTCQSHQTELSR